MKESWKDIRGLEGCYQISDKGQVKSLSRRRRCGRASSYTSKTKILRPSRQSNGYLFVLIGRGYNRKSHRIHRLVAEAFIPNPTNKPTVNHKDGNKNNNYTSNLEWLTRSENQQHAFDNNLMPKGSRHWKARLTEDDVRTIKTKLQQGLLSLSVIAKPFKVSTQTIHDIKQGITWKQVEAPI